MSPSDDAGGLRSGSAARLDDPAARGGRSALLAGPLRGLLECDEKRRISAAELHVRLAAPQVRSAPRDRAGGPR